MTAVAGLKVISPGLHAIVVDGGRYGAHALGITSGGPADTYAFRWANRLCHNDANAPALEMLMGGAHLKALTRCLVSVTGALDTFTINGQPKEGWMSHWLAPGDELALSQPSKGLRQYLAVAGGVVAPQVFGSATTVEREQLGGLFGNGRSVAANDVLHCVAQRPGALAQMRIPSTELPDYGDNLAIRFVFGYQWQAFDALQRVTFVHTTYQVSAKSDRMGMRLTGAAISAPSAGILSEGLACGAIQIPPDGQPIVMLKDRQTIGGYPKLGCVLSIDADRLGQAAPGSKLQFDAIDMMQAHNLVCLHQDRYLRHPPVVC